MGYQSISQATSASILSPAAGPENPWVAFYAFRKDSWPDDFFQPEAEGV